MSIALGDLLVERFVVKEVLGEGCFAIAYVGIDLASGSPVVIKQLKQGRAGNLAKEYGILKQLEESKYIPTPVFLSEDASYFVTSFEGKDIFTTLADNFAKTRAPRTPCQILLHSLLAIKDVHDRGFVHGDISSRNITISENREKGKVLLIDFGTAREYSPDLGREDIKNLFSSLAYFSLNQCKILREQFLNNDLPTIDGIIEKIQEWHGFGLEQPFEWQ